MPYTVSLFAVSVPFTHRLARVDSGIEANVDSTTALFLSTQKACGFAAGT